jgi:predicted DNA-binding transcriptional regulator YafY
MDAGYGWAMRASRLMAMLLYLQATPRATATTIAGHLEVSVRTVYRDVAALQSAGVPLWTETGPGGGIRLLEGWRTRLDGLTGDEAGALFLSGARSAASELGLGAVLTAAESKVLTTLPPELRSRAGRMRERFHLDAPGWFHRPDAVEWLAPIADAVWTERRLEVQYRRGDGTVTRTLDPLGLVSKAGTWYLVARVAATGTDEVGSIRTYRVGRVASVTVLDERFVRPDGFDLPEWWARSSAEFDRSLLRFACRLRLSPPALRLLPHVTDPAAAQRAIDGAGPPDDDGWREVALEGESAQVLTAQLLGLGAGVEVLEPGTMRAALRDVAQAMASRNAVRTTAV